jgi:hypothetical protein
MVSFHIEAHLNAFLQILEYYSQIVDVDGVSLLAYSVFELLRLSGVYFYTICSSIGPKRNKSESVRSGDLDGQMFLEIILP